MDNASCYVFILCKINIHMGYLKKKSSIEDDNFQIKGSIEKRDFSVKSSMKMPLFG